MFNLGTPITVLNGPIIAIDHDLGANAVVSYRLLGSQMDLFTMNINTGMTHFKHIYHLYCLVALTI